MRYLFITLFLMAAFSGRVNAQEYPPTQYFSSPLAVNPANTGLIATDIRATVNSGVWNYYPSERYYDAYASVDMPISKGTLPKGDFLGVGVVLHTWAIDQSWNKSSTTFGGLSFAWHQRLGKTARHHISAGMQTIMGNYVKNYNMYDSSNAYYERGGFVNLNVGAMYSGQLGKTTFVYAGYSRYASTSNNHDGTTKFLAGATFSLTDITTLYANSIFFLGDGIATSVYTRFLLNAGHKKAPVGDVAAYVGFVTYMPDRFYPYIGFEAFNTRLGFSINPRSLSGNRFVEDPDVHFQLSLIYQGKLGLKANNENWHCPVMY